MNEILMYVLPFTSDEDDTICYSAYEDNSGAYYSTNDKHCALTDLLAGQHGRARIVAYVLITGIHFNTSHEVAVKSYSKAIKQTICHDSKHIYQPTLDLLTNDKFIAKCLASPPIKADQTLKGTIINTPNGKAKVVGFERFNKKGFSAPMASYFHGSERIICELLEGHTWGGEGLYCLFANEFKGLNP